MAEQTRQAIRNMRTVLEAAGGTLANIVSIVVYTTDIRKFKEIVAARMEFFNDQPADQHDRRSEPPRRSGPADRIPGHCCAVRGSRHRAPRTAGERAAMTSADRVFSQIVSDIHAGVIRPRDAISERDVVHRFGVSRTPAREAIKRLFERGLLRVGPRRVAIIKESSEKDLRDLYDLRLRLEAEAANLTTKIHKRRRSGTTP